MAKKDHAAIKTIKEQVAGITLESLAKRLSTPEYRVNKGYLSSVLRGQRPASNRLRLALGLHPLHVTVEPCPTCGTVTLVDVCPVCHPPEPEPEPKAKRPRRPDPVVRVKRVDAARVAVLSALYANRGIGEARYRLALKRELDAMTG